MTKLRRCIWVDDYTQKYHDEEWGEPVYDDRLLFEMLVLESFQAGLSWVIVLKKREGFRAAFDNFDPELIKDYSQEKIEQLQTDDRIIKSKAKIVATVNNAKVFLAIQQEFGSFANYLWKFTDNKIITIHDNQLPEEYQGLAAKISKNLKKRGMKFMGEVTTYSYLQAIGVVNNHDSFCYKCQG
ncbi:DNA-3-methyladenine glycosylase I [[Clostridium] polysaccharolyticum]|uniref:DNA-3-methyladenine glycosylase I n=1 Tax=[Clostridium] polysaccharolyticum TaxID=29364 RepID=A0A1I0C3K5_9FIRM|nr:DNA-3-methyladenine glycosylase I [[Clostridium] polysaccharolyticum]SET14054.1 DNA-3-methyladenine glycosylase I [[Clostridium] polysaccharolyticum]